MLDLILGSAVSAGLLVYLVWALLRPEDFKGSGFMTIQGLLYIALVFALVLAAAFPLGRYMAAIFEGRVMWLRPVELGIYRLAGVDETRAMRWQSYAIALLLLSVVHFLLLYAILRLQYYLPWNPQHIAGMSPRLAFNTAASFATNTNWQAYVPEAQISNGAQMLGLTVHMFISAATGIAAAVAVMRAFTAGGLKTLGNFWADLTRVTLYLLLPRRACCRHGSGIAGAPQTFGRSSPRTRWKAAAQTIALGPVAFQEAIKELGTNGGGFFNANSAHPFENPNAWTNLLENFLLWSSASRCPSPSATWSGTGGRAARCWSPWRSSSCLARWRLRRRGGRQSAGHRRGRDRA